MIRLGRIMALGNCLMLVWVERLADNFSALVPCFASNRCSCCKRHRHTLMKLLAIRRIRRRQRAFEIINDGQQFLNE